MDIRSQIFNFLKSHNVAVIATTNASGNPESGVIEFGQTEDLELIFDTFYSFRKVKNIKNNNHVSFAIGGDEDVTVQYEGIAIELNKDELSTYKEYFYNKIPKAKKWENKEGIVFFKVIPQWIRYTDLTHYPWDVEELLFDK